MANPLTAAEVLSREFLEIRSRVLEVAAALDRLERADGEVRDDPRMKRLREALLLLTDHQQDRAEQVQLVFSRSYDDQWQTEYKILPR
jgi:hypothetical protein